MPGKKVSAGSRRPRYSPEFKADAVAFSDRGVSAPLSMWPSPLVWAPRNDRRPMSCSSISS